MLDTRYSDRCGRHSRSRSASSVSKFKEMWSALPATLGLCKRRRSKPWGVRLRNDVDIFYLNLGSHSTGRWDNTPPICPYSRLRSPSSTSHVSSFAEAVTEVFRIASISNLGYPHAKNTSHNLSVQLTFQRSRKLFRKLISLAVKFNSLKCCAQVLIVFSVLRLATPSISSKQSITLLPDLQRKLCSSKSINSYS